MSATVRTIIIAVIAAFAAQTAIVLEVEARPSKRVRRKAKKLFRTAEKQYRLGKFERALGSYEGAYDLLQHPAFLFNIGQCHRQLKNWERVVFFMEAYVRDTPGAEEDEAVIELLTEARAELAKIAAAKEEERRLAAERVEAERKAAQLERDRLENERLQREAAEREAVTRIAAQPAANAMLVPSAGAEPADGMSVLGISGLVVGGLGAVGAGIGTYFAMSSQDVSVKGKSQLQAQQAAKRSDQQAQIANGLFLGAGGSVLIGTVLFLVDHFTGAPSPEAAAATSAGAWR